MDGVHSARVPQQARTQGARTTQRACNQGARATQRARTEGARAFQRALISLKARPPFCGRAIKARVPQGACATTEGKTHDAGTSQ